MKTNRGKTNKQKGESGGGGEQKSKTTKKY